MEYVEGNKLAVAVEHAFNSNRELKKFALRLSEI